MKFFSIVALFAGILALADSGVADAQSRRSSVTVVSGGGFNQQSVNVRVQNGGGFNQQSVSVRVGGFVAPQAVRVSTGGTRQNITVVNQTPAVIAQRTVVVQQPAAIVQRSYVNHQIVQQVQLGQLNQLNTFSTSYNRPAAIQFIQQQPVYLNAAPVVAAPIVVQQQYQLPAQQIQYQQVQPVCNGPTCAAQPAVGITPVPTDPSVQYSTVAPQNVVVQPQYIVAPVRAYIRSNCN